jgi:hypothetical protein
VVVPQAIIAMPLLVVLVVAVRGFIPQLLVLAVLVLLVKVLLVELVTWMQLETQVVVAVAVVQMQLVTTVEVVQEELAVLVNHLL